MLQLIDYLPQHFREVEEFRVIMQVVQEEIDLFSIEKSRVLNNQFLEKADEFGISKLEKIYDLRENNSLDLEDRRFALWLEINDKRPVTIQYLEKKLKEICGENNFVIIKNYSGKNIEIRLALDKKNQINAVKNLINKIIPCNMTATVDLLYSPYESIETKYVSLENMTHEDIKEGD